MAQVPETGEKPAVELEKGGGYPRMVTFEQRDGTCEAFHYEDLTRLSLDLDSTVKVRFTTATIVVRGRNLLPVWQGLRTRRARLLRVALETDGFLPDKAAPHIDSITITPLPHRK